MLLENCGNCNNWKKISTNLMNYTDRLRDLTNSGIHTQISLFLLNNLAPQLFSIWTRTNKVWSGAGGKNKHVQFMELFLVKFSKHLYFFNIEGEDNIGTRSCHFSEACECGCDVNLQQFEPHSCALEWPIILLIEFCGQSFHPRSLTVCILCVNRFPRLGPQRTTRKMSNFYLSQEFLFLFIAPLKLFEFFWFFFVLI